jgi:hypothetical protein
MHDPSVYNQHVYLGRLSASPKTDYGKRGFGSQCEEQKVFSAIWELESQVGNGGFEGYFGNGAEMAAFAPGALRAIGAPRCAALVEQALALVPPSMPTEWVARWEAVHSLPKPVMEQFERLNRQFFADPEGVIGLLYRFVAAHPSVFGPTPQEP